jgi:hypothetical protein
MWRSNERFISGESKSTDQLRQSRFALCFYGTGCVLVAVILALRYHSMKQSLADLAFCIGWWIFSILLVTYFSSELNLHSRFALRGVLIAGVLQKSTVSDGDAGFGLEVEYSFVTPDGERVEARAKGNYTVSNIRGLTPVGYSQYNRGEIAVSVSYLGPKAFILL